MDEPDSKVIDLVNESSKRTRWVLSLQLVVCIVLLGSWWPFSKQGWLNTRIERVTDATAWHPFSDQTYRGLAPEHRQRFLLAKRFCEVHNFAERRQIVEFQNQQVDLFWAQAPLVSIAPFGIQLAREDMPTAISLALSLTTAMLLWAIRRERENLQIAFGDATPACLPQLYRALAMAQVISSPPGRESRSKASFVGVGIAVEAVLIAFPVLVFWTVFWFNYGAPGEFERLAVVAPANTLWQALSSAVLGAVLTCVSIVSVVEAVRIGRAWRAAAARIGTAAEVTTVERPRTQRTSEA